MLKCPQCGREFEAGLTECPYDATSLRADPTVRAGEPTSPTDPADDDTEDPLLGRTLDDKYRLDERLGEGGMGAVYRATHLLIERPVAVKVLRKKFVEDESARSRFRREARAAGRLRHSNAVAVTDFGETHDGVVYIVMELLEGRTLRDIIVRDAPLDPARAVSLMLQASAAVAAAHEAGVIHRDLKPGNIFVVQRPNAPHLVKVLDFGIAKIADESGDNDPHETLTGMGMMIGTPRYMSPEQCDGTATLTPASDVYSLGVIFYEMLTGQTPFDGITPLALALRHASEVPRPLREITPTIPPSLEALVLRALAKDPAARFADAAEFRRELYELTERLGLEHSAGFSAPTVETIRESGIETPSGRIVVDMESVRRRRAAANTVDADAQTVAEEPVADTADRPAAQTVPVDRRRLDDLATSATPASGERQAATAAASPSPASSTRRMDADTGAGARTSRRSRLTEPPVLVALICLALLVTFGGLLWWRTSGGEQGRDAPADSNTSSTAGASSSAPPAQSSTAGRAADAEQGERIGRTLTGETNAPQGRAVQSPQSAAEFFERGTNNFYMRDYDAAIRDFRRAIELQPDFPSAHNRLGRAYTLKGQFAQAAASFRTAVEQRGGDYPTALYNLGFALQQQGRGEQAIEAYTASIERSGGTYPDAYFQIGEIYFAQPRRQSDAATAYRRAIEQNDGRDPEALFKLGIVLARSDDLAGAETTFREAIAQRKGEFAYAYFNLALVYEKMNRLPEAVSAYEAFITQAPKDRNRRAAENSIRDLRRSIEREGNQGQ